MADFQLEIPAEYNPLLGIRKTEEAIKNIKDNFEDSLARRLNLERVSAPRFVESNTGVLLKKSPHRRSSIKLLAKRNDEKMRKA